MKPCILALVVLILSPPDLFGQQDVLSPFRVEGPRISRTAFTNWEKIELTFTLGYYDGYEPMYEDLRPNNMTFSPLEMDPNYSLNKQNKLDRRNERTFQKEHFIDVIYHLRYANEKKGDLEIVPSPFSYRKLEVGKEKGDTEVKQFKIPKFLLKYGSVLTPDPNLDIKDKTDFGSFLGQARAWHWGAIGLFLLFGCPTLYFMFRRPVYNFAVSDPISSGSAGQPVIELHDCLVLLSSAGQRLGEITVDPYDFYNRAVDMHNASRRVLETYVPGVTDASTVSQIEEHLKSITFPWLHQQLSGVYNVFQACENYLYQVDLKGDTEPNSGDFTWAAWATAAAKEYSLKLQPRNISWQKRLYSFRQKIDYLKRRLRWKSSGA